VILYHVRIAADCYLFSGSSKVAAERKDGSEQSAQAVHLEYQSRDLYLGLARTMYIRCIYVIFGRQIPKYTVIYGVYIRFWPTLLISVTLLLPCPRFLYHTTSRTSTCQFVLSKGSSCCFLYKFLTPFLTQNCTGTFEERSWGDLVSCDDWGM
jgi:hypothetical protein